MHVVPNLNLSFDGNWLPFLERVDLNYIRMASELLSHLKLNLRVTPLAGAFVGLEYLNAMFVVASASPSSKYLCLQAVTQQFFSCEVAALHF